MSTTCLITGGTAGIGRAMAEEFLSRSSDQNDRLILNYRQGDDDFYDIAHKLDSPSKLVPAKADLSTQDGINKIVSIIQKLNLSLDQAIFNVGVGLYQPFDKCTIDEWNAVLNTNLTVPIFLLQGLLDRFTPNSGSVLFMGSYAGIEPYSSSLAYGVSKAALIFSAKALVKELEPRNIRINALAPGFIETRWQKERSEQSRQRINDKIALHRFGTASEVARAAFDVIENPYLNGSVLEIHGGYGYY